MSAWYRYLTISLAAVGCSGSASGPPEPVDDGQDPTDDSGMQSAPVFGPPITQAVHNRMYTYALDVTDPDGDALTVGVTTRPAWLSFDQSTLTLSGTAGWDNVGTHPVTVRANDGQTTAEQSFVITVAKGEIICNQDFGDPASSIYILPFPEGRTYQVIQTYCPPNPAWGHHNWFAYDFDLTTGDTVIASRAGRVRFVREDQPDIGGDCSGGKENLVFIQHDDGSVMSYVHFTTNGALVDVGDEVAQGQPVGLSGNSGCSSGPHLHVSLHRDTTDFGRKGTIPFNYSNADGPLDANRGLLQDGVYTALTP